MSNTASENRAAEQINESASAARDRAMRLCIGALLLAPVIVVLAALVGRPWHPTADLAIIDLRVRDVWSLNTPLTGLYSRAGWNHPGPVLFSMLSLASLLGGHAAWATRIGGTIMQAVALGWLVWVASARGSRMLLAAATTTALLYLGLSPEVFRQPWNVFVPLPFFAVFIFLVCFVAAGSFRQVIGMSVAGTIIVQTHVAYTPLVVAGFVWALGCAALDARRGVVPDRWRSTLAIATAIWVATWIPPLVGVLVHTPGNLGVLFRYFTEGSHPTVGLHRAIGIMAAEFRVVPPWLGGHDRVQFGSGYSMPASAWWLLVPAVLLAAGAVAARHTRSRSDARMVGFAALLLVVGIVAVSQADEPRAYTLQWRILIAAFVVVASLWPIAAAIAPRLPRPYHLVAVATTIFVVVWGCGVRAASEATPENPESAFNFNHFDRALAQLMEQLDLESTAKGKTILVRPYGTWLPLLFQGVVDALDRRGVDVKVDGASAPTYGSRRVATATRADEVWYVIPQGSLVDRVLDMPGARRIAATDALDAHDELTQLQQSLARELQSAGRADLVVELDSGLVAFALARVPGIDQRVLRSTGELNQEINRKGCRCAIVAVSGPGRLVLPPELPGIDPARPNG
jgi:hypothetical protein